MKNPPREVKDLVFWVESTELDTDWYESLRVIAWTWTNDSIKARKVFDKYYLKSGERLNDLCSWMSRGDPVEIRCGNLWVLCGFDYD